MAFQMGFISHFGLKRVLAARRLERRGWTGRGWARTDCGPLGALQGWGLLTPIRRFWVTRGRALCWTCGLDVWAGRGGWTRGARRRFLAASLGLSSTAETVRKRSARPLSILRAASGLVLTGFRPVSPAGRLGRVRRRTGPRLLPGRPVHQPGGLLHLPLPDGQGRQPRPSRPGLCWCVPNPPPLRLWALLPPGAWGRGRGRLLRPVRWTQRGGPPHTIRPTKWFHFNFF